MIDDLTAIYISDLVDHTARRMTITRAEAKVVVLDAARAVCTPAPAPSKPVKRPTFAMLIPYGGTA